MIAVGICAIEVTFADSEPQCTFTYDDDQRPFLALYYASVRDRGLGDATSMLTSPDPMKQCAQVTVNRLLR